MNNQRNRRPDTYSFSGKDVKNFPNLYTQRNRKKKNSTFSETLTFIHTNDIHARIDQFNNYGTDCTPAQITDNKCYGGVARIRTVVDKIRAEKPGAFLFDAGDQFQGTLFYSFYKGNVTAQAMNDMKYDLMTVGNHEFDDGPAHLAKFFKKLNFPVVSANMITTKRDPLHKIVKPYHLFPEKKLAVIGYITNTTGFISNAGPTIKFLDTVPTVQRYVDMLRKKGYKKIIAVSHNGYEEDQDVARRTSGLDLIVGGHSHTFLSADPKDPNSKGPYPTKIMNLEGEPTYIVQAYCWGRYIGNLDVTFDANGVVTNATGAPILLDQTIPRHKETAAKVTEWRKAFDEFGKTVIGNAVEDFPLDSCQTTECAVGDLLSDSMLEAFSMNPEVQAAVTNAGGIRAGFSKGPIRQSDIMNMLPFGNSLAILKMTGKQVKQMFENVFEKKNSENGKPVTSFIQVSGFKVAYNPNGAAYNRLRDLQIRSKGGKGYEPVKDDGLYSVVFPDFVANGGDSFVVPTKFVPLSAMDEGLKKYISDRKDVKPEVVGQRIRTVNV